MQTIYHLMETVLPFSWVSYDFMKNALLAIFLICPMFGLLGTAVVNGRMAFFSDALGHSALTGIGLGLIFGIADTNLALALFGIVFALCLKALSRKNRGNDNETVISVFSSLSTALGLVILSKGGGFAKYAGLMVGDILSISPGELGILLLVLIGSLTFYVLCSNKLAAISISEPLARSRGIKVSLYENLFAVVLAVIVMMSIRWIGILIINALLILPAAAARSFASNAREYHLFSVMIALFSGILGLILSFYLDVAAGPLIVVLAAIIYFVTLLLSARVR